MAFTGKHMSLPSLRCDLNTTQKPWLSFVSYFVPSSLHYLGSPHNWHECGHRVIYNAHMTMDMCILQVHRRATPVPYLNSFFGGGGG